MAYVIQHIELDTIHKLRLEEPIIIILEENLTTGYIWEPEKSDAFTFAEDSYPPQEDDRLSGGFRKHQFVFLPVEVGSFTIHFRLQRPWDSRDCIDEAGYHIDIIQ